MDAEDDFYIDSPTNSPLLPAARRARSPSPARGRAVSGSPMRNVPPQALSEPFSAIKESNGPSFMSSDHDGMRIQEVSGPVQTAILALFQKRFVQDGMGVQANLDSLTQLPSSSLPKSNLVQNRSPRTSTRTPLHSTQPVSMSEPTTFRSMSNKGKYQGSAFSGVFRL
ncbi:hypothetical protein K435DRAFT_967025, partial [Dendrothele bispora CBS 962.96]